jgi:hypothetical protein
MSKPLHDPEIAALEAALAGLAPLAGSINRDRLLFRAGQASMRRGWRWPCATALLAVVSVALGGLLWLRPAPQPTERIVYVPVPEPSPAAALPSQAPLAALPRPASPSTGDGEEDVQAQIDSLNLRNRVVRWGVDMLPRPPAPSTSDRAPTMQSILGLPLDASKPPRRPGDAP